MSSLPANELAFTIVVGLILTISVVCNIMVVVVVMVNPGLRNPTNLLICNLSVGDLILASVVLPQNLHDLSHVDESYFEGAFLCKVVYTCPLICIMASIYSMVAISFERTQVILITRSNKLTIRRTVILLAVLWIFAVIFALPTAHEHSVYVRDRKENGTTILGCGTDGVSYEYSVVNGVWLLFVAYLIPLVILLVNYWRILRYFWRKGMFGRTPSQRDTFKVLFKTRMTVVKMFILVAAIFAVCWAPYFAILLLEKIMGISDAEYVTEPGSMVRIFFAAFSTAYNFGLYVVYNRSFRQGLLRLLGVTDNVHCCGRNVRVQPCDDGMKSVTY